MFVTVRDCQTQEVMSGFEKMNGQLVYDLTALQFAKVEKNVDQITLRISLVPSDSRKECYCFYVVLHNRYHTSFVSSSDVVSVGWRKGLTWCTHLLLCAPCSEQAGRLCGLWCHLNCSVGIFWDKEQLSIPFLVMTTMWTSYATLVVLCCFIG